jgi:hypothetical protein
MGAVYWDSPDRSITKDELLRTKFRKAFGPLKAMHYYLARLKSAGKDSKFWWSYSEITGAQEMKGFRVEHTSSADDYGMAFVLAKDDLAFSGTTLGGAYTVTVTRPGGFAGFVFERGCFGETDGVWHGAGDVRPVLEGEKAVFTVEGDSGDAARAAIRVYRGK